MDEDYYMDNDFCLERRIDFIMENFCINDFILENETMWFISGTINFLFKMDMKNLIVDKAISIPGYPGYVA